VASNAPDIPGHHHLLCCARALAFGAFLLNIVMTLGLKGAVGVFQKSAMDKDELLPMA